MTRERPRRPIGEDDLHAYIDGQLGDERRLVVEHYLAEHPEIAKRFGAYATQSNALRRALAWRAAEPVPPELAVLHVQDHARADVRQRWSRRAVAASLAIGLGLGGSTGWIARELADRDIASQAGVPAVASEATQAVRILAGHPARASAVDADQEHALPEWLATNLGRHIAVPDLRERGYRFQLARLLMAERGMGALLVYGSPEGEIVALYLRAMADPDETTPMMFTVQRDVSAWAWADRGMGFAVSVPQGRRDDLKSIADLVRGQTRI
jgi:anti-sigma factor RsiW